MATAVLMTFGAGSVFAVLPDYAGWQTGNWNGIHGFLRQSTTVSTTALHAVWITICGHNDCNKWVQTGTYQGTFAGGSHPTQVRVYTENVDACGDYYVHDWGVPPAADTNYFISWNGASSFLYTCNNGSKANGYTFNFRMGSSGATPFASGILATSDGLALAKTELQGYPPINTDYFGCRQDFNCDDTGYQLRLYNGSVWSAWTGASTSSHANPPWLHTFHNYWSFKTCPSSC